VLVLHRTGDRYADVHASRYMAERLPSAWLVELPGDDSFPFYGDQDAVVTLIQEFLTGAMPLPDPDRVLATVLFTDRGAHRLKGVPDQWQLYAVELAEREWVVPPIAGSPRNG
jgi:hypothetical protein